jgi:hypothetical protein
MAKRLFLTLASMVFAQRKAGATCGGATGARGRPAIERMLAASRGKAPGFGTIRAALAGLTYDRVVMV